MPGLNKEVWLPGIIEQPVPDHSFVMASTDMSEYVDNNTLNLAEAGVEPGVHENYFDGSENDLPLANIEDIPHALVLNTYSTEQTRHRNLQEAELAYNKRMSVINRHRAALGKNIGLKAAHAWTPSADDEFNRLITLGENDSFLEALIDLSIFYKEQDKSGMMNICLAPIHEGLIKKENLKLYKEVVSEKGAEINGFKIFSYSKTPLFTSAGVKKPFGSTFEVGDKRASFTWCDDEVFRCFGDVEMFDTLRDSGKQADTLSFAQRALVGKIRANNPKYLGAII